MSIKEEYQNRYVCEKYKKDTIYCELKQIRSNNNRVARIIRINRILFPHF